MTPREILLLVHVYREDLVAAHDVLFKFRLRNLFRPMKFGPSYSSLEKAVIGLEEVEVDLKRNSNYWIEHLSHHNLSLFAEYLGHLKQASIKLRDIAGRLELKAEGQPYPYSQYRADVANYRSAAERYASHGPAMNTLFKSIPN